MIKLSGLSLIPHPLGEIRMGMDAYGITLKKNDRIMKALANEQVFDSPKPSVELATESRSNTDYLILHGLFATYVVDLAEWKLSLFRATIRGQTFWTEENPIYGRNEKHLNGQSGRHYFVQFPFVSDNDFLKVWQQYHEKRVRQIRLLQGDA